MSNVETMRYYKIHRRVEVLLDNMIDKDVQSMLLPLKILQNIMFCPKYAIKSDFITPNDCVNNLVSLFATVVFISAFINRFYNIWCFGINRTVAIYFSYVFDIIYYCIGYSINFVSTYIYSTNEVEFVLTFQKIHRLLNDKHSFEHCIIFNWIYTLSVICSYIFYFIYFSLQTKIPYYELITITLLFFDFNMIFAIRFIKLLESKLVVWNIQCVSSLDIDSTHTKLKDEDMFQAFVNILKCYKIYKVIYQYRVRLKP